ncbi:MAG: hypothetical protein RQ751_10015 [Longimicrobiales bacterium]|nr:hypothetical protein [Longimicrobiales bacterium]
MTRVGCRSGRVARAIGSVTAAALLLLAGAMPGRAQGLAEYDYDQLGFRGVGLDFGYIFPGDVEDTPQYSLRVDLGYLGPGLRLLPRVAYFSSSMTEGEVAKLERRVAQLVFQQNPLAPVPEVDLGIVDWSALTVGLDAQFVWRVPFGVLTYLGAGVAAHFQNGGGDAIDGTFVEDLLDSTVGGFNGHAGLEVPLNDRLRAYGDFRYELAGDLSFPAFRLGLQFMFTGPAPGEVRGR